MLCVHVYARNISPICCMASNANTCICLQLSQRDIMNSVDRETSGDYKKGLLAIGKVICMLSCIKLVSSCCQQNCNV